MAKTNPALVCCGDCANVTPVMEPEKLSVKGEPILGTCPYWTESRCTLLSWRCICNHYEDRINGTGTDRQDV